MPIALMVYGPALKAFHNASASPEIARRVHEFAKSGLQLNACGNTMRAQKVTRAEDLLPGFIKADCGGAVRLVELQSMSYVYLWP